MRLDRFARHKLTFGPTPIEKLPRLSAELGGKVEIFAKRDDCNSGLAFGGNKVRKLEYLVPEALAQGCAQVLKIARATADLVELGRAIGEGDVVLDTRFAYPAYGIPSEETLAAIRLSARTEGMLTDPVYEGKSMQGMMAMIQNGEIPAGSKVLYVHLGGVPAINGYSYLFRNG